MASRELQDFFAALNATVFPDREARMSEAKIWKALSTQAFSVVFEPA
jgi:hypothetical protein